jgi:hypothetical protein
MMAADPAGSWLLLEQLADHFYDPWIFWGLPFLLVPIYELWRRLRQRRRRR